MLETQGMKVLSADARVRYRERRRRRSTRPRKWCGSTAGWSTASLATTPHEITLHAVDPERHVPLSNGCVAFAPTSGPPNIMDTARGRRAGTFEDFCNLMKLCQSFEVIHVLGGATEPQDVPVQFRHLHVTRAQLMLYRQDPVHLFARPRPGRRQLRAHSAGARHLARGVPLAAVRLHHHQHQFAAAARHADGGRHHRFRRSRARCSSSRRSRSPERWRR